MVINQEEVKKDLETIRQLLHAGLSGEELLKTVSDFVKWQISLCFAVLYPEKLEQYVYGEVVNLLWSIAVGTISDPSISYLLRRYSRLCANLVDQKFVKSNQNVYFSQLSHEDSHHEDDFVGVFIERHSLDPLYWVEESPLNNRGKFKRRTLVREKLLRKVEKFSPGCLKDARRKYFFAKMAEEAQKAVAEWIEQRDQEQKDNLLFENGRLALAEEMEGASLQRVS